MKKVFITTLFIVGMTTGISTNSSAQTNLERELEGGGVTCYSSWTMYGDLSVVDCLGCSRVYNVSSPRDKGSC